MDEVKPPQRFWAHWYFLVLLVVNVIFIRIAAGLYAGGFHPLVNPLSDLGATVTEAGLSNRRAPLAFVTGMILSSLVMFLLARRFRYSGLPRNDWRVRLARMCAVGFLIITAPHNLAPTHHIHMVGGGFIYFSLWVFAIYYLAQCRSEGLDVGFWIGSAVMHPTIVAYAVTFAVDSPSKQVFQMIGLIGVVVPLVWSTIALATVRNSTEAEAMEGDRRAIGR